MAWCENENCGSFRKNILRKADVEFCETTGKVLCHGCYVLMHPGWQPPREVIDLCDSVPKRVPLNQPRVGFAFEFTEADGLRAQISYGTASIAFLAQTDDLKRLFGN